MIRKLLLTCGFLLGLPFVSNAQQAVIYTTTADESKKLERIVKQTSSSTSSSNVITLLPEQTNQSIDGFGYAITYSSCYNLLKMPKALRHSLLKKTFSNLRGYGASYVRISIGCNDFSSTEYSLCDVKGSDDNLLENFALQGDETNYVLPVLKEILAINPTVKVIATPWTCPKWMKVDDITNKNPKDSWTDGHLNPDYYDTYAQYFVKFIDAMKAQGVNIYAVSPQNEPLNKGNCASLYFPWSEEADFVKILAAKFKQNSLATKIYIYDHNYDYDNISDQDNYPLQVYNKIGVDFEGSELVVGAAYHNYGGNNGVLNYIHGQQPEKELIFSETSIGEWNQGRDLGVRLVADMKDVVLGTLNKWCKAVLVCNFMLDTNKGPNLDGGCTTCYGAVDIDPNGYTKLSYNSHYYIISHISSIVKPGAYRIDTKGWWANDMDYSAYKNPDGSLAVIFASSNVAEQNFTVYDGKQYVDVTVPANSVVSVLFGDLKEVNPDIVENGTYDFVQNKSYRFSDEEVGAVDPDFFFKNLDESGTYRFLGTDGKYTVTIDNGMLTAKSANAEVYVSGSPKTYYKAGLYESTAWNQPVNLAQVAPGVYRMTVKAGESVNSTELNFKFFSTENWGDFDIKTLIGLAADKLVVSDGTDGFDKGNIHYKDGETLDEGSTYIFTIKTADHSLDLQKQYDITDKATLDAAIDDKAEFLKFTGSVSEEMLYTLMHYKDNDGVIRYLDFSEAFVEKLPKSFMSMGNVSVVEEGEDVVRKDQVNGYLEKVLLPNGLKKIGNYAFSSCNNLRVINLTRDIETFGKAALMYDYRLHALSLDNRQTAATVTIPMSFMQMYNNVDLYKEEYAASSQEGLKELYIGDNWTVDSIGRLAFFQNQNLFSFKYSDHGTTIGDIRTNAFTDAHSLPADDINNIIKNSSEIWNAAFYSCRQLDRLTLPVSLKMVDNAAFGDCPITDIYVNSSTSPTVPLYDASWYPYSWNYFSEYAFAGIRNKTNGTDKHVRQNAMRLHFGEGVDAKEYRYTATEATDETRINENGEEDEATGKAKYGEFLRLLTKSIYQDHAYDISGQDHADLRIYRTFKSNWNTICLPVTLTAEQVKKTFGENTVVAEFIGVQKGAVEEENILKFKTTHEGIIAGKPYIIMLKDDYGNNVALDAPYTEETYNNAYYDEYVSDKTRGYYLIEDINLPSADHLPELQKVTYDKYTFVGNYAAMNISADNKVLYISNNLFRYKNAGETTNSAGYRAYFIVSPNVVGSGLAKSCNISIDDVLTSISTVCRNGEHDSLPIYDLMGCKVNVHRERLAAGIYIIGGKKFVVE